MDSSSKADATLAPSLVTSGRLVVLAGRRNVIGTGFGKRLVNSYDSDKPLRCHERSKSRCVSKA